jgi:hypothetical protein
MRNVLLGLIVVILVGLSASAVLQQRTVKQLSNQVQELRTKQDEIQWESFSSQILANTDFITADVGSIQFLRRGFSISLETVNYAQDGLNLSGQVGNPTNLTLQNLTMTFEVRPYFTEEVRKKWEQSKTTFPWWSDEWNIGSGQTSVIAILLPKTQFHFSVTIPNVKQSKDGFHIAVFFSGERYSYF